MAESPLPSPRRPHFGAAGGSSGSLSSIGAGAGAGAASGPSSPRPHRASFGFSPTRAHAILPSVIESAGHHPRLPPVNTAGRYPLLSPQLTTPIEQQFQYNYPGAAPPPPPPGSGGSNHGAAAAVADASSPRMGMYELPPRSRRNSAAIVSISLSSRSRSRTPRGSTTALPGIVPPPGQNQGQGSGNGTPSKIGHHLSPRGDSPLLVQMGSAWPPRHVDLDDWQPAGGMLLGGDDDESALLDDAHEPDSHPHSHSHSQSHPGSRSATSDDGPAEAVMKPGMVFGEGLEFQGEIIEPAVGKNGDGSGDLPLRRGGSEVGQVRRIEGEDGLAGLGLGVPVTAQQTPKKRYEVVRQLGTGSYAVVYLVREKGGRRREYALKCLSKQDLEEEQIETQLFEAHIHLSLPIHQNIVTLHQTLHTRKWLFLMLELCPGEDLFYWLEKSRDVSPPPVHARLPSEPHHPSSSSKFSSSSIPFSSSQLFGGLHQFSMTGSYSSSPFAGGQSPASLLFAHHNGSSHSHLSGNGFSHGTPASFASATPPTPSLLSAFAANTLLSPRRLRLIASMFSQMCEAVAVCHDAGVSHRDIKPENFICCDSIELETVKEGEGDAADGGDEAGGGFGPQAKRKVVVKLTDFGLATTEEESGDVECGSKPYMSYECRNNLGPTYLPAPADVWSLGIVLINMLFHRNPWKDPTEGDPNFDNFLRDPTGFFLSKFTGVGREVASYLADRVLCVDVDKRVGARAFGKWIRNLPEMIAGKKALLGIKIERKERERGREKEREKSKQRKKEHRWEETGDGDVEEMFVKSPVAQTTDESRRKVSASALTMAAPGMTASSPPPPPTPPFMQAASASASASASAVDTRTTTSSNTPTLSALAASQETLSPEAIESSRNAGDHGEDVVLPMPELDPDELTSATTVDEQPTPLDATSHAFPSPEHSDTGDRERDPDAAALSPDTGDDGSNPRSLSASTHKRRKRGVRKGKAAQAALAAAAATGEAPATKEERDALLVELAAASQSLARDLSTVPKKNSQLDLTRTEDFPPLGTSPAQIAQAKKSKWKELIKISASSGNPELAALAQRVAERDAGSGGNWSAPAKLQGHPDKHRSPFKSTATASSGFTSSAISSFGPVSSVSATSSMSAAEDDDWRKPRPGRLATHKEEEMDMFFGDVLMDESGKLAGGVPGEKEKGRGRKEKKKDLHTGRRDESPTRARQAALAAAAITGNMEPMGAFGRGPNGGGLGHGPLYRPPQATKGRPIPTSTQPASAATMQAHRDQQRQQQYTVRASLPIGSSPSSQTVRGPSHVQSGFSPANRSVTAPTLASTSFAPSAEQAPPSLVHLQSVPNSIDLRTAPSVPSTSAKSPEYFYRPSPAVGAGTKRPPAPLEHKFGLASPPSAPAPTMLDVVGTTKDADVTGPLTAQAGGGEQPNKAKIKGQIGSLAKMLSSLKVKPKE